MGHKWDKRNLRNYTIFVIFRFICMVILISPFWNRGHQVLLTKYLKQRNKRTVTEATYKNLKEQHQIIEELPVGKLVGAISHPENAVYLTFDDGPGEYTKQLVSILDQNRIKGSFIWIGSNLKYWAEENSSNIDFARYMVKEGDVIGSHTMKHLPLSHKSPEEQEQMIKESTDFVSQIIGYPVHYFRPPYGAVDQNKKKLPLIQGKSLLFGKWTVRIGDIRIILKR